MKAERAEITGKAGRGGKKFPAVPAFLRLFAAALLLCLGAGQARAADAGVEFGAEDDLTVLGTGGNEADPDVEIKGFTVFGQTAASFPGAVVGPGNVVINGFLLVSSGSYHTGITTFTSAGNIYINDGSVGQIMRKDANGALYWDDVSALGDNLGNHVATATLNMAGFPVINVASLTVSGTDPLSGYSVWLASGVYAPNGRVEAALFSGSGLLLTGLNADALASGTVPLARLSGITSAEISPAAGILDTQLGAISTAGKVYDTALSTNVVLLDSAQIVTGPKTFESTVTVVTALGGPRFELGENVSISSEASADLGAGVTVSSNVYIIGFASATKYYGDGSSLSGLGGSGSNLDADTLDTLDSLDFVRRTGDVAEDIGGDKNFKGAVSVSSWVAAPRLELFPGVAVSSEASADLGAGVTVSTNLYVMGFTSAAYFYGDGSHLTGMGGAGSGLDADLLDGFHGADYVRRTGDVAEDVTGAKTFTSSMTVTTAVGAPRLELGNNVSVSSEAVADLGGGVTISTNVYIVGFASATKFYGDGSALTGMGGAGSNLDADTLDTLDSLDFVRRTGDVAEDIGGDKSFKGAVSVSSWVAAPRLDLAPGVSLSSTAAADLGGGVAVSTNLFIVGYASAPFYFGDGSALVLNASNLASGTVPLERLSGITYSELSPAASILDTQLDVISTAGKVYDSALSTNVVLLDNTQTVTGVKTFQSTVTVTAALGTPRVELGENVSISTEALADVGGGVTISSNVYIVGFASATAFYGDGSHLVLGGSGSSLNADFLDGLDNLDFVRTTGDVAEDIGGDKSFKGAVSVSSWVAAPRLDLAPGVSISSEASVDLGGGVAVSTNLFIVGYASAPFYFGDGSALVLNASNLASGTVPLERLADITAAQISNTAGILDTQLGAISTAGKVYDSALSTNVFLLDNAQTVTGYKTFASSVVVSAPLGTPRLELADNVSVAYEPTPELGGGVGISTNVYIVGFASAAYYFGDGSNLTGIGGSGSNLDADTLDTLDSLDFVRRTGDVAEEITGAKTFTSSVTVLGPLAASGVDFGAGMSISSDALSGALQVSTSMNVAGAVGASAFVGDGAGLTNVPQDNLGTHIATMTLNMAWNDIVNVSTISVSTLTSTGPGIYVSTHLFTSGTVGVGTDAPRQRVEVIGKVRAEGFCIGDSCQLGALGVYTGATSASYNGNRGGYDNVNSLCSAEFAGAHVCTNAEILFSINNGLFAAFPANTTLWISNGPPGYTVNANDCMGWTDSNSASYGPVWNKLAAGHGFGSLNKCDNALPRAFACCR